jgi:predicted Zn-dependent protease
MPEKSVDQIPAAQREMFDKGVAALQKNNLDYAVTLLLQVVKNEPGFYECREALRAAQHKRAGNRGGGMFRKLLGSASSLTRGQMALRSNPFDAIIIAEEALNDDPSNMAAHELLAEAALLSRLPKTALLSLEVAFRANPANRKLAEKLSDAHSQLGNRGRAERILRDLLAVDPHDPALNEKLKNLLANRTMDEGGYQQLADGSGSYRDILRDKEQAKSLEMEGREVKDADVASRLIAEQEARLAADPDNQKILRTLAELNLKKGDTAAAIGWFERVLAVTGLNDPQILQQIRDARLAQADAEEKALDRSAPDHAEKAAALRTSREAFLLEDARRRAEANPTDLHVRFELGELYFRAGRIGEAIAELQKAQNNPTRRIAAMNLLARAFARRGMNDLAARKLEEALKEKLVFDEEAKDLRYELGTILEKVGRAADAMEQFKLIYEQDISYRDVMARVDAFYAAQG